MLALALFIATLLIGLILTALAMPGTWLMVVAAAVYAAWGPAEGRLDMSLTPVLALAALAGVGELLELLAATSGVAKVGGSRRGAVFAIGGSIVGGLVGMVVGVPVPVVGSLLAALLFGGAGAMVGAVVGEMQTGRTWADSVHIGRAAFVGRLLGTLAKLLVGLLMVLVAIAAVCI